MFSKPKGQGSYVGCYENTLFTTQNLTSILSMAEAHMNHDVSVPTTMCTLKSCLGEAMVTHILQDHEHHTKCEAKACEHFCTSRLKFAYGFGRGYLGHIEFKMNRYLVLYT